MRKFFTRFIHLIKISAPALLPMAIFVALCSLNLNSSIWFDESYSSYLIRGDYSQVWQLTSIDVHPPLFYFALKTWSLIFGHSVVALRLMSVFFGAIAIFFAYLLIREITQAKTSNHPKLLRFAPLIAATVLAICPIFVRYGQEMRMYTMVFAIILAATLILERALATGRTKFWLLYGVLVSFGMWTHYFSALAWLAQLIYIIYRKKFCRQAIGAYALAVALYLPWLPSFLAQAGDVQGGFWIPEVNASTLTSYVTEGLLFTDAATTTSWAVALIVALIAGLVLLTRRADRRSLMPLAFLAFIPPAFLALLSFPPFKPIFIPRYCLYAAATTWLLMGLIIILAAKKTKILAVLTAALLAVAALIGNINVATRDPSGHIADILSEIPADGVPILPATDWLFYDAVSYSDTRPVYFYENWSDYRWGSLEPIRQIRHRVFPDLSAYLAEHPTVWLITDKDAELPIDCQIRQIIQNDYHTAYFCDII